jgi:hypothetical protein
VKDKIFISQSDCLIEPQKKFKIKTSLFEITTSRQSVP